MKTIYVTREWENGADIKCYDEAKSDKGYLYSFSICRVNQNYFPKEGEKDVVEYGVNWSAIGTQTVEDTRTFMEGMEKAVKLAEYMTNKAK